MVRFLIRRMLQGLITLFLLQTAVFFFIHLLMPGDFVSNFAMGLTASQEAEWRAQLGLNLPIWQQYLNWLKQLVTLDLGTSFYGYPVVSGVLTSLPGTVLVFATGLAIAFWLGQWLGRMAAWKGRSLFADSVTFTAIIFYAFFPPSMAILLSLVLGKVLRIFPYDTLLFWYEFDKQFRTPPERVMTQMSWLLLLVFAGVLLLNMTVNRVSRKRVPPPVYALVLVMAWVGSWYVMGIGPVALWIIYAAGIPILAFILLSTGEILVITRTSMADTLDEQYVQTARAKGLKEHIIRDRHAGRNAMLPVLSKMTISLPYLLGGLAIIEKSLGWQGMGAALFDAAQAQDIPTVFGFLLVIGLIGLIARLFLEVMYAYLDPRIRFSAETPKAY